MGGFFPQDLSATNQVIGFRNRVINGNMRIDQRNVGAITSNIASGNTYMIDRFYIYNGLTNVTTTQQVVLGAANTPPKITSGFSNSPNALVWTNSATASTATSGNVSIFHTIEGNMVTDLGWGTTTARTVTLSFWVYASIAGTYCVAITNYPQSNSFVVPFLITSVMNWQQIKITVPGPSIGTWNVDTNAGICLIWTLHGSTDSFVTSNTNTWQGTNLYLNTATQTNLGLTASSVFAITGVQLELGTIATQFEWRPWETEMRMCQRYYEKSYDYSVVVGTNTNNGTMVIICPGGMSTNNGLPIQIKFLVEKRVAATPRLFGVNGSLTTLSGYAGSPAVTYTSLTSTQPGTKSIPYTVFNGLSANLTTGYSYAFGWDLNADF